MLALIAAIGENNELGKNGKLPWSIKKDLEYFKKITLNHVLIMGRVTFESLPRVLPQRKHIVLSRNANFSCDNENVLIRNDMICVFEEYRRADEKAFVIGGGEIYKEALPFCDYLYLTKIAQQFDADVYFPSVRYHEFMLLEKPKTYADANYTFSFNVYKRKDY